MKPAGLFHRATALLLLLVMLVVAALFVVKPVRDNLQDMDRRLAEDANMIRRLFAGSDSMQTYREALVSVEEAVRKDQRYLVADSPALASAALQQFVRQGLESTGATLRSIQDVTPRSLEADAASDRRSVTVRATVVATYPDLVSALRVIEANTPYLFLERLSIRSPQRIEPSTDWAPLTVQFDVTGFMPPIVTLPQ